MVNHIARRPIRAFKLFQLGGNALGWMVPKVCINKALRLLGNVLGNGRERLSCVPLQDHVISRVRHVFAPRGRNLQDRKAVATPS